MRMKLWTQNNRLLATFLDFCETFVTVDYETLLPNLEFYDFTDESLQWFSTFLSNRTQFVGVANKRSFLRKSKIGVTQGSTLVQIFFLNYINDLYKSISNLFAIPFADDTTLYT